MKKLYNKNNLRVLVEGYVFDFKTNQIASSDLDLTCKKGTEKIWIFIPESTSIKKLNAQLGKLYAERGKLTSEVTKTREGRKIFYEYSNEVVAAMKDIKKAAEELGVNCEDEVLFHIDKLDQLVHLRSHLIKQGFTNKDFATIYNYYDEYNSINEPF